MNERTTLSDFGNGKIDLGRATKTGVGMEEREELREEGEARAAKRREVGSPAASAGRVDAQCE